MIILDDPASKAEQDDSISVAGSSSQTIQLPPYTPPQQHNDVESQATAKRILKRRKRKRIRIAILAIVLLYLAVLGILIAKRQKPRWGRPPPPWPWKGAHLFGFSHPRPWKEKMIPRPLGYIPPNADPTHGNATICNNWDFVNWESARLRHTIPANTSSLFFTSYASKFVSGAFEVTVDDGSRHWLQDNDDTDSFSIRVEMRGRFGPGKDTSDICLMQRPDGSMGLAIYESNISSPQTQTDFNINLRVPPGVKVESLLTRLPNFSQVFGKNQTDQLSFGSLSLGGPVARLETMHNQVRNLTVDSVSPLQGEFSVTESLTLRSQASAIDANITMVNRGHPFSVLLETQNAPIRANIRLIDLGTHKTPPIPTFPVTVSARTIFAPLSLRFDYGASPRPVVLDVVARTEQAPVRVYVPPAFEGLFDLSTDDNYVKIHETDVTDPTLRNRTRTISIEASSDEERHGSILWHPPNTEKPEKMGRLDVRTTHAKANLYLEPRAGIFERDTQFAVAH